MKKAIIGVMLGLFLSGVGITIAQAEEHTKEYLEWEEKTTKYISLSSKCLKVKNNVKKITHIIESQYSNPDDIVLLVGYIEYIRKAFIILHRDTGDYGLSGTKLSDIPSGISSPGEESTRWFILELSKAMEPVDDLAYVANKTKIEAEKISSIKLESLRFLHVICKNLQNGGDIRKALRDADVFEGDINHSE